MKTKILCTFLPLFAFLSGCASSYNIDFPNGIEFVSNTSNENLKLYYKYDVLTNKYAKKEQRSGIKVIAVKIENKSDREYTFGNDLFIEYRGGKQVSMLDTETTFKSVKQGSPIYLLYLLLTPFNLTVTETDSNGFQEETASVPLGLVAGPGLAFGNIIAAGSANKKFKSDLENFNIVGKKIKAGETIYGIIPIQSTSFDALALKVKPRTD